MRRWHRRRHRPARRPPWRPCPRACRWATPWRGEGRGRGQARRKRVGGGGGGGGQCLVCGSARVCGGGHAESRQRQPNAGTGVGVGVGGYPCEHFCPSRGDENMHSRPVPVPGRRCAARARGAPLQAQGQCPVMWRTPHSIVALTPALCRDCATRAVPLRLEWRAARAGRLHLHHMSHVLQV